MSDPRSIAPVSGGGQSGATPKGVGPSQVEPGKPVSTPDGASVPSADDVLNARLQAAGMYTIPQMMGVTPLTRWTVHVGMTDLDFFETWLDQRVKQFLRMKAGYELGDKDKDDELYEWVGAHCAAFSEMRENFRAVRAAMAAPCDGSPEGIKTQSGLTEGNSAIDGAPSEVEASNNTFDISPLRAEIETLRTALAFYADETNYRMNGPLDPNSSWFEGCDRAARALADHARPLKTGEAGR